MAKKQSNGTIAKNGRAHGRTAVLDQTVAMLKSRLKPTVRPLTAAERERLRPKKLFPEKHAKA